MVDCNNQSRTNRNLLVSANCKSSNYRVSRKERNLRLVILLQVIIFSNPPAQQKAVADGKVCPEDRRGSRCYVSERVPVDQPEEGGEGEEGEEGGGEREQDRHQPDYL